MTSSTTPSERSIGFLGFMLMLAKNPFNHVGMTQKVPYMPILVVLGPKLWSVTLKLCQRAYSSVPLLEERLSNPFYVQEPRLEDAAGLVLRVHRGWQDRRCQRQHSPVRCGGGHYRRLEPGGGRGQSRQTRPAQR